MIHSLLSLASLALAQDADVVEQTGSDVLEILLDFGLDVATAASTHPGDFFEFVLDGDIETSAYNFEVVDSSGTPIFDIVNVDNSLTFRATATDYFLENTQALEGQIASDREMAVVVLLPVEEGATFSFGYTLGEGLGFPSDSEPVQITHAQYSSARPVFGFSVLNLCDHRQCSRSPVHSVLVAYVVDIMDLQQSTFCATIERDGQEPQSACRGLGSGPNGSPSGFRSAVAVAEESASVSSQSAASAEASATASSEIVPISGFSSATSIAGNLSSASDLADVTEIVSTTITTTQTATYCKDGTCGNTVVVLTTCVPVHHTVTTCPTVIEGKTLTVLVPCEIETGDAVTTTEIVLKPTETVSKPIKTVAKATETVSKPIKAGTTTVVTILDSSSIMPVPVSTVTGTIVTLTSARPIVPQVDSVPSVVPQANAGSKLTFGPLALLPFLMV
ncbi:hypothetical protein LXG23DRAFT_34516 [Yarrowia lipolytica]|nr:hypothetical protein LXG23DRAFT_34516 [Yarrowia lipolytica]